MHNAYTTWYVYESILNEKIKFIYDVYSYYNVKKKI
jgi:hypothetical protein